MTASPDEGRVQKEGNLPKPWVVSLFVVSLVARERWREIPIGTAGPGAAHSFRGEAGSNRLRLALAPIRGGAAAFGHVHFLDVILKTRRPVEHLCSRGA